MSEYHEAFEAWAKHNPWIQENKEEAYQLWYKTTGWKYFKKARPKKAAKKKTAKATKPPKKKRWKRKGKNKNSPAKKKQSSGVKYHAYIKSAAWRKKSKEWREAEGKCEICGATENLQCHHKHYKTLGHETREDVQVVCYKCHCKLHNVEDFDKKK